MFLLCCSIMCSDFRMVTQLPQVRHPSGPERISNTHNNKIFVSDWIPLEFKDTVKQHHFLILLPKLFLSGNLLLDRLTPSMMESKPEVIVSSSESLALCRTTTAFALGGEWNRFFSCSVQKKSHTIFEIFSSELLEKQFTLSLYSHGIEF